MRKQSLGLTFYINSEASLPLVRAMIDNGMSQGAALAFMISGAGTSIGAITGALTIALWRMVALVVATLWIGAMLSGLVFNWMCLPNGYLHRRDPGLQQHITYRQEGTPATFARYAWTTNGSIYGPAAGQNV